MYKTDFIRSYLGTGRFLLFEKILKRKKLIKPYALMGAAILMLGALPLSAQQSLILYNMPQVPQSNLLNPAKIPPMQWYFGLPFLSGASFGAGNTSFTYDLIDDAFSGEPYDFTGLLQEIESGSNRVVARGELQLINFGIRSGKGYFTFDISDIGFAAGGFTDMPIEMFQAVQANSLSNGGEPATYNLDGQEGDGAYYRSYSLAYAHQLPFGLSLGARVRYLQGVASLQMENQELTFNYPGSGEYFQLTNRMNIFYTGPTGDEEFGEAFFPGGNNGFAFDIGGVYRLDEKVELSLSAVNLGRIRWEKDVRRQVVADPLQFSAVDIDDHLDLWGEIFDDLSDDDLVDPDLDFNTTIPVQLYFGGNYQFRPNTSVGLVVNPVFYPEATDWYVALSGNNQFDKVFGISAAVTYNPFSNIGLGLGFSFDLGPFQFYTLTDNLIPAFNWRNAKSFNGMFGINFGFGKMLREESI